LIFAFKMLYLNAVIYIILGLYCNEVVPQQYGIAKHPLFFAEKLIRSVSPSLHKSIFGEEDFLLKAYRDDNELVQEDVDAKAER